MAEDLKSKILTDISKTGFPLELRISDLLQRRGYHVANNLYYVDRDEKKGREIDIRGLHNSSAVQFFNKECFVKHCLLVECKKSERPWVVFTSPCTSYDVESHGIHPQGIDLRSGISTNDSNEIFSTINKIHPCFSQQRRGRSYFEQLKQQDSHAKIFGSLITAIKATIASKQVFGANDCRNMWFYYPMVVLEGRLFEAYLGQHDIVLDEVDTIITSVYYESDAYKPEQFIVPIITENALDKFLASLEEVNAVWAETLKNRPYLFDFPTMGVDFM